MPAGFGVCVAIISHQPTQVMNMSVQPYREYYKEKLEKGLEFQDFVTSLFFEVGIAVIQYI